MRSRSSYPHACASGSDDEDSSSVTSYEEVQVVVSTDVPTRPSKSSKLHNVSTSLPSSAQARRKIGDKRRNQYLIISLLSLLLIVAYCNNASITDQLSSRLRASTTDDLHYHTSSNNHEGKSSNRLLPDWRIVTECSAYNTDCASHIRPRLLDYPFKVKTSETVGQNGAYDFEVIHKGEPLPQEWSDALTEFAPSMPEDPKPLQLDGDRLSALVFPAKISIKQSTRCYQKGLSTSFDEQLDNALSNLHPIPEIDMIAFTMTDAKYSKEMLVDVWEMSNEIVGFRNAFFFLALDEFTLKLACEYGYPVVAAPALITARSSKNYNKDDGGDTLKALVQSTKFTVSRALVDRMQSFFFYEMDCWFLKSPIDILKQQQVDYLVSGHQWNPTGGNIGIYSVKANEATQEYFKHLVEYSNLSPNTHDQIVMNDLASYADRLRSGAKVSDVASQHLSRWDPIPEKMPVFKSPISREFFGPHEMVASPHPIPTETSIAIHTLDNTPLQPPHGKIMVAKELGAYTGFVGTPGKTGGGYYKRTGPRRRYLMMDGRVLGGYSAIQKDVYHNFLQLQWHIAALVALARRTNRIFVLPRIAADFHVFFLWANLDMESLEGLVDVRETNFPSNKKAWYSNTEPFKSVARVALFPGEKHKEKGRMFAQTSQSADIFAWSIEDEKQKLDGLFGLIGASPELHEAEALFFNPAFTQGGWDLRVANREQIGDLSEAEKEILYVFDHLKWCGTDYERDRPAVKHSSSQDCYGKGKHATRFGRTKNSM